jgi:hypothetical protein
MIFYLGDNEAKPLAGTPAALMERRTYELINAWHSTFGIRALDIDQYGVITADISGAPSPQSVFAFMESVGCVCCDLQPQDIPTFAGRSPASLAASDLLLSDPGVQHACSRLTPEEVMETISELIRLALAAADKAREEKEQYISKFDDESFRNLLHYESDKSEREAIQRLRDAGMDVPDEIDLTKPYSSFPDLAEPDNSDFFGPDKVTIDPWKQFGNE